MEQLRNPLKIDKIERAREFSQDETIVFGIFE